MYTSKVFEEAWNPQRPLATDILAHGVWRQSRKQAAEKLFIETTVSTYRQVMVFDSDEEDAALKIRNRVYDDEDMPEPNWVTTNPLTGHAHIGYVLDGPVGTHKGLRFYDDVYKRLRTVVGGDEAYNGRITRNPLQHPTQWWSDKKYTLAELGKAAPRIPGLRKPKSDAERVSNGRNDELFHSLSQHAYKAYRRLNWNGMALESELADKAWEYNLSQFDGRPMTHSEVRSIVKSVSNWVQDNFSEARFSEIQSYRAKQRWGNQADEKADLIMVMVEAGFTVKEIASNMGLTYEAAKSARRRAIERKTKGDN